MAIIVAIAGGTSGWGKTLVEQIQKESGEFEIIIFTRSLPQEQQDGVKYAEVDYDDIPVLTAELNRHAVHIVISVIGMYDDNAYEAQSNLITAAEKSSTVQKFIPSEYSYLSLEKFSEIDPGVHWWSSTAERLKKSRLQFTRVIFGMYMDCLARPNAPSHTTLIHAPIFDIVQGSVVVPGDGKDILSMTYSYDAATFVAKILDLKEWPEFSICAGDDLKPGDVVKELERAYNKKFRVVHVSAEDVALGKAKDVLPEHYDVDVRREDIEGFINLSTQLGLAGAIALPRENRLGDRLPGFKPRSLKQFLSEFAGNGN